MPAEVWQGTLEALLRYGEQRSEGLVFWGGVVAGAQAQVTGAYILDHRAQGSCVRVIPDEARWLVRTLRERDEKLLAQVHSHPGEAYHSTGDDDRAASFHEGYISIVVPHFARGVQHVTDCAVFEFDRGAFVRIGPAKAAELIRVLPLIERRAPVLRIDRETDATRKPWLTSIVSNLRQKLTALKRR